MNLKRFVMSVAAAATLGLGASTGAQAAVICNGCNYIEGAPATYLGAHNALTNDSSSFQHIFNTVSTPFDDYWVFDIAPVANSSISADYTALAAILAFGGELFADGGSTCAGGPGTACATLILGGLVASDSDPSANRFELLAALNPGRYVIHVEGTTNADGDSIYTGQMAFEATRQVPEPGTLLLLALGLIGIAGVGFRRAR